MWPSFDSWLVHGLRYALSLAQGGRRSAQHVGQVVTRSHLRFTTKLRDNWTEAITETVATVLVILGAAMATHYSLWILPIAFVGLVVLPAIPALIHNTRLTGRPVLPRTSPSTPTQQAKLP